METVKPSIERLGLRIGLITSAALIAYFLLMKVLGIAHVIELRLLNFVILGIGVCIGIYKLKKVMSKEEFYLKGLAQGFLISAIALVPFAIFITSYLQFLDNELMQQIKSSVAMGDYINWLTIFFVIIMEGLASGAILTFAAMQYFKTESEVKKELS